MSILIGQYDNGIQRELDKNQARMLKTFEVKQC